MKKIGKKMNFTEPPPLAAVFNMGAGEIGGLAHGLLGSRFGFANV